MTILLPLRATYWALTAAAASAAASLLVTTLLVEPLYDESPTTPIQRDGPWFQVNVTRTDPVPPVSVPDPRAFTAHPDEVRSHLPFSLLATLELENPRESLATILDESSGDVRSYTVGQRLAGTALIAGIEDGRVHLVHAGKPEYLTLERRPEPRGRYMAYQKVFDPDDVRCVELECTISRDHIDWLLSNPASMASQARVVPAILDGRPTGLKLYGIRRDSLPKRLGLKNGDLITAINGAPLVGVGASMESHARLKRVDRLDIDVERRGEPLRIVVHIE